MITTKQIRQIFIDYFCQQGHHLVPSSALIPQNDPTLLFTNAGMVQFKETFLGLESRPYARATSVQRCVRAGGKHNDLDNVGYTARHHTFFEMLGNFSFGDYFKREAIHLAWKLLIEVFRLPPEKLWVTVFEEDHEAEQIWLQEVGISPARFSRIGAKDNFWQMGDTGPCGPCTEIFYDHGPSIPGGPPGSPEADGDRYIEIWNLVFMQFNREADGSLTPLPKPSVDTGMGLERLAAVLQGVHDNYEIDLFQHLIKAMALLAGTKDLRARALRVIADHIRSCAFLIADGVLPSNEGRGYVLRRIMRRAIRYGHKLGVTQAFFYKLVEPLVKEMGEAYPDLAKKQHEIESVIRREEEQFAKTLEQGLRIFEQDVATLTGQVIPGETIFKLYDTYGFPVDLTADIARERQFTLDMTGFEQCMEHQREMARASSQFKGHYGQVKLQVAPTQFVGYDHLFESAEIEALIKNNIVVESLVAGEKGGVVLPQTPFYAESGGQVGDTGILHFSGGRFQVTDTQKQGPVIIHMGEVLEGELRQGMLVEAIVDENQRLSAARNHSATHLLHAALKKVLGAHVEQKGSLVDANRLRFDFSHPAPVTQKELREVEQYVNQVVRANIQVKTELMPLVEAIEKGAEALFGEKYEDTVRVLSMGHYSTELCGGTHVNRTGDIGLFKITLESGIAAGVRRLEAITGEAAVQWVQQNEQICIAVAETLNCARDHVADKLQQTFDRLRAAEKTIGQLQEKVSHFESLNLLNRVKQVAGVSVVAETLAQGDPKHLRHIVEQLKTKLGSGIIVLSLVADGRVHLIVGVTQDLKQKYPAGQLIQQLAILVDGKGGGRPDFAQGGGTGVAKIAQLPLATYSWIEERK